MTRRSDHTGKRFGRLTALEYEPASKAWRCRCDCGQVKLVAPPQLVRGRTKSCGCFRAEVLATSAVTHGLSGTPAWHSWRDMMKRCYGTRSEHYADYGGRGINVCEQWHSFEGFFASMGERAEGMSIERDDVNGNYQPSNCRWLPKSAQPDNTRRTIRVSVDGVELPLSKACRRLGLAYNRTRDRMQFLGWSWERARNEPKKINGTLYA